MLHSGEVKLELNLRHDETRKIAKWSMYLPHFINLELQPRPLPLDKAKALAKMMTRPLLFGPRRLPGSRSRAKCGPESASEAAVRGIHAPSNVLELFAWQADTHRTFFFASLHVLECHRWAEKAYQEAIAGQSHSKRHGASLLFFTAGSKQCTILHWSAHRSLSFESC